MRVRLLAPIALVAVLATGCATTSPSASTEILSAPAAAEPGPGHERFPDAATTSPEVTTERVDLAADPSRALRDTPSVQGARGRIGSTRDGHVLLGDRSVTIGPDGQLDWADQAGYGRSFARLLHGHLVVRDLAVLAGDGDPQAAGLAMRVVDDWVAANPRSAPASELAWHDETTALRTMSWLDLYDVVSGDERQKLSDLLVAHVRLLLDEDFHSAGTNHGMFQDRAILAWATSPAGYGTLREASKAIASARLIDYLTSVVSSDGVHLEHSPSYHQVVLSNVDRFADFFEQTGDDTSAETLRILQDRMAHYAIHVLQPDGTYPLIGDTSSSSRPSSALVDDPHYRYAVSAGAHGEPPPDTDAFFPEAGYAIMRDAWTPDGSGTYLHFNAAYHGSYHKHADDLSLWLYHDGELLTEAGPNGYEYDDPYTVYAFGAASHNVVLVDGHGVPRVDGDHAGVRLTSTSRAGPVSVVAGTTSRLQHGQWERQVRYDRRVATVIVTDHLQLDRPRSATLLWHTAPDVRTEVAPDGSVSLTRHGSLVATIMVTDGRTTLAPIVRRGTADAQAGWQLGRDEPIPVDTLSFETSGSEPWFITRIDLVDAA